MGKNEELEKELKVLQDRVQIEKSASVVEFNTYKKKCDEKEQNLFKENDKKQMNNQKEVLNPINIMVDRGTEVKI